jgi:hypothetical protein
MDPHLMKKRNHQLNEMNWFLECGISLFCVWRVVKRDEEALKARIEEENVFIVE